MINTNNNNNTMMMTPILTSTPTTVIADGIAEMPTSTPTTTTPVTSAGRIEKPERNLWREQEMLAVLQIIREKKLLPLLNDKTVRSEAVFRKVEREMFERGFNKKNFQQIWTKWKFLKSTYMTSRRVHQIPKIIPLEVYESLDELLSTEFQNDGSMSSYDGGDYEDGVGSGGGNASGSGGGGIMMSGSGGGYEMMNASVSRAGSNDGYLPVISNVQGNLPSASSLSLSLTSPSPSSNTLFNGGRNYAPDLNGFGGMRRNKFKNGFRSSFKNEEDTNGFGMQHPIFGYRLGVVKDEPIDDEYENNNNATAEDEGSFEDAPSHDHEPTNSNSQQFSDNIKPELVSPPSSPSSSPSTVLEDDHLPVPVIQSMGHPHHSSTNNVDPMEVGDTPLIDSHMPPLHRYTPPPLPAYQSSSAQSDQQLPPPLKQMPFMKIQIPPKPQISQITKVNHHHRHQVESPPTPTEYNSKKIPVLTLRKRKKRLNIPDLSEGTQSPAPSSKHSKISDEDDSRESPPETSRIPFLTYGKAMREMSASLRDIQREMIDDFFKQQMDLARSEHEFQKQQDAMLLRCFEDQTKLLLDGAKRLFTSNNHGVPIAPDGDFE